MKNLKKGWKYGAGAGLLKRKGGVIFFQVFKPLSFLH